MPKGICCVGLSGDVRLHVNLFRFRAVLRYSRKRDIQSFRERTNATDTIVHPEMLGHTGGNCEQPMNPWTKKHLLLSHFVTPLLHWWYQARLVVVSGCNRRIDWIVRAHEMSAGILIKDSGI